MENILIVKTNMNVIDFGGAIIKEKTAINTDKIRLITGKDIKKLVNIDNACELNNFIKTSEYNTLIFMCETLNFTYKISKCINDAIRNEVSIKIYSDEIIKNVEYEISLYDNDTDLINNIIKDLKPKKSDKLMVGNDLYNYRKSLGISLEELSHLTDVLNDRHYSIHTIREFELSGICNSINYINFILKLKEKFNTQEKIECLKIYLKCQKNYKLLMYRTLLDMTTGDVEKKTGISDAQINRYERNNKLRPDKYLDLIKFYQNKVATINPKVTIKCINLLKSACNELKYNCENINKNMSLNEYMQYFSNIEKIDRSLNNIFKLYNVSLDEDVFVYDSQEAVNMPLYCESDKLDFSKAEPILSNKINLIDELKLGKKLVNNDLKKENSYLVIENNKLIKYTVISEEIESLSIDDMLRTDWEQLS